MATYRVTWGYSLRNCMRLSFSAKFVLLFLATAFAGAVTSYSGNTKKSSSGGAIPVANHTTTYTTNFPLKEDPFSEGSRWINGQTIGLDWGNISTTPGLAIGHPGLKRFADATAILRELGSPRRRLRKSSLLKHRSIIQRFLCAYDLRCCPIN